MITQHPTWIATIGLPICGMRRTTKEKRGTGSYHLFYAFNMRWSFGTQTGAPSLRSLVAITHVRPTRQQVISIRGYHRPCISTLLRTAVQISTGVAGPTSALTPQHMPRVVSIQGRSCQKHHPILHPGPGLPTIILQWTGGRAVGHHSFEDFDRPILISGNLWCYLPV